MITRAHVAHGSGSSRHSLRNQFVARFLVPIGIVSIVDIVRASLQPGAGGRGLTCERVIETLAEICELRPVAWEVP